MKLTDINIKQFEQEQKDHGTRVALYNMFFTMFKDFMEIKKLISKK